MKKILFIATLLPITFIGCGKKEPVHVNAPSGCDFADTVSALKKPISAYINGALWVADSAYMHTDTVSPDLGEATIFEAIGTRKGKNFRLQLVIYDYKGAGMYLFTTGDNSGRCIEIAGQDTITYLSDLSCRQAGVILVMHDSMNKYRGIFRFRSKWNESIQVAGGYFDF